MNEPVARGSRHRPAVAGDPVGRLGTDLTRRLGEKTAKALAKLGVRTEGDLLRHYPFRYGHLGALTPLGALREGEDVTVIAQVVSSDVRPMRNRRGAILSAIITDGRHELTLTFFGRSEGQLAYHARRLSPGVTGMFSGIVSSYRGARQLTHPEFELLDSLDDEARAIARIDQPIPIYHSTAGLRSRKISSCVEIVLTPLTLAGVPEPLPGAYREEHGLMGALEALHALHAPRDDESWRRARDRMRHEEAFVLQTALAQRRAITLAQPAQPRAPIPGGIREAFEERLPFTLTGGQREVGAVISDEISEPIPMMRLLQGEVGSGKTVVALRAMLQVIDAGGQAALLAPTEVLAHQHHRSITAMLGPLAEGGMLGGAENGTRVALLTGSMSAPAKKKALAQAASGEAGIVIGTHALLGEHVQLADLGLVVVDEQHRFGVEQRDALRAKATSTPHLLVMTATPIPRTVAMTTFGDLETSVLSELPVGRPGVSTVLVPTEKPAWLARAWERIREEVDAGGRAYVVCPRISATTDGEEDDDILAADDLLDAIEAGAARPLLASVEETAELLRTEPALAGVPIGTMHGRLSTEEKDDAMAALASGEVPVLVSTTVVEVGVDVPEATVMVILNAERFGLSQLHQLRGRIGRGTKPGVCLAVTAAPPESASMARVEAFASTTDGFRLADLDLEQRREGDVLGASQSGTGSSLRLLRVTKDADIIDAARGAARALVDTDPDLLTHPDLAEVVARNIDEERAEFLERT